MKKRSFALLVCTLVLACLGVLCAVSMSAQTDAVFCDSVNGKDTNNGADAASPVKTLDAAYGKLKDGGTIVVMSDLILEGDYSAPEHKGTVTLTSKYNGKEYGGKLINSAKATYRMNGSTVFTDITLKNDAEMSIVCQFNPIVLDNGFKVEYSGERSNLRVIGGFLSPDEKQIEIVDRDSNITVNSGEVYLLIGLSKTKGKGVMYHTGTSNVTINGGKVGILCGGTHANHAGMDAVININGGEVDDLRTAGDVTRRLYGDATVNINGGKVTKLDVNNVIGNATVNLIGALPEKISVTYKSDELLKMAEKNNAKQTVNYNALICTDAYIKQLGEIFDETVNTTCIYVAQNGKGDGSSQASALGSLSAAYTKLTEGGGRVIVSGQVKCDLTTESLAKYNGRVTVAGIDGDAAVIMDAGKYYFESDTVFENIKIKANGDAVLYACCKSLELSSTVKTEGGISVVGTGAKASAGNVDLTLNGGTFKSVVAIGGESSADDIDASVNLGGASVESLTLSERDGKFRYGAISVSSGKVTAVNTCRKGSFSEMSVKVLGGEIEELVLNGAEKSLFFNVSHATFGKEVKAESIPEKAGCVLLVGSEVDERKLASVKERFGETKNGNIIYVSDNGTGNGVSPDAPMGSLNDAVKALGGEGSIVILGTYTISEKLVLDEYSYPVTITSVGSDRDYRSSGACIVFGESLYLGGETVFEKVELSVGQGSTYIYAMSHKLVIGDEVNTSLTNSNTAYINIAGGRDDKILTKKGDVTVSSGDWGIVRGGSTDKGLYNDDVDLNLTVNGGVFHRYVVLSSRGHVNGKITATINGGKFLQGLYAVYEDGASPYKADYDVNLTINGGEFYQSIAPARHKNTTINGYYRLELNGGDFSSVTDILGTEEFLGSMSSSIHISDKIDINKEETGVKTFQNPVDPNAPDPWIFYHEGYYYYTHTTGKKIILTKVTNIGDITTSAETVVIDPTEGEDMWSPEIHYFSVEEVGEQNAGWYLFIAYDHGESGTRRAHVLKCKNGDDFFGDWVNPITGERNKPEKIVFPDYPELDSIGTNGGYSKLVVNGKTYMTFIRSVNRGTPEYHQKLCIAEIDTPWSYKGTPVTLAVPEYDWECHGYGQDSISGGWYPKVIEGASAVYGDNGEVYIMYTGSGYWTKYYALGYLKYLGGDPLDPASWKKNPKPILSLSDEVNGCGHGSYFKDHNGDYYVAYHGYLGKDAQGGRYLFVERIYVEADRVSIGNGSGHPAPLATEYKISANPMPLAKKISGFTEKDEAQNNPIISRPGADTDAVTDTAPNTDGKGNVLAVVIVAACVLAAGGVGVFFGVKSKKKKN